MIVFAGGVCGTSWAERGEGPVKKGTHTLQGKAQAGNEYDWSASNLLASGWLHLFLEHFH